MGTKTPSESLHLGTQALPQKGRFRLPLDLRLQIFQEVDKLRSESLTYKAIIAHIENKHHVVIPKGTISGWLNGKNSPFRAGHVFVPRPIPELAYVIGSKFGDASLNAKRASYQYRIRLKAMDREFVEEFSKAVAVILQCAAHTPWRSKKTGEFYVEYGSYLLHAFLKKPLSELASVIEHDVDCVAAFLRGFFDSEGWVGKDGSTGASNTKLATLEYVLYLLKKYLQIEATGPHLGNRKGSILIRRGKTYYRNADCFSILIKRASLKQFHRMVRLTIKRKSIRLERLYGPA